MKIVSNDRKLKYSGRIDWTDPAAPVFIFPCTSVCMGFTGKMLKIHVANRRIYWDSYLGYILDGVQGKVKLPDDGEECIDLSDLISGEGSHEIMIFKRQDACHVITFYGFEIEDDSNIIALEEKTVCKMEVYGDSVSAGEVSEAVAYTGKEDPKHDGEYSNSWYSYAWMTARKLGAEIHNIAQGGIALMDGTGWFYEPDYIGMESVWDKVNYIPDFGQIVPWDFSQYTPQVVLVAIGQNDSHPYDFMKENYNCSQSKRWREHYKAFLLNIRERYPDAYVICCTTLLKHNDAWDCAIDQVVGEVCDKRILHYTFSRNGKGTPGHLRISEAEEMAEEMAAYIRKLNVI